MKKFIIFILIFFNVSISQSQEIAIIDLQFIINNSNKGKDIQNELKKIEQNNIKFFKENENLLNIEREKLIKQSNVISKEIYEKEKVNFNKKLDEYKLLKENKLKEWDKLKKEKFSELLVDINKIIINYIDDNKISTILDKKYVIITKSNSDITKIILNNLNEQIK
jgi:Skp family chaperone for outer membrane proteins